MKKDQQDLLYRRFQTQQYIDHREATEISKEINMPVKMIKAWFSNMRRKVKRNSKNKDYLNDSNQFDIKQPTVSVLMDMNHLNSLKTSLESGEIVINDTDDEFNKDDLEQEDEVFNRPSLDTTATHRLFDDSTEADIAKLLSYTASLEEDRTPLIKQCTTTNGYISTLLEKIEELEDGIKDKEGEVYFMKKDLDQAKADLDNKERVLNTIQQSIPKVVKDHKDALASKDAEIIDWKFKYEDLSKEMAERESKRQKLNDDFQEESEKDTKGDEGNKTINEKSINSIACQTNAQETPNHDQELLILAEKNQELVDETKMLKSKLKRYTLLEIQMNDLQEKMDTKQLMCNNMAAKNEEAEEKISELKFELNVKTVEIKSMSDTIKRLNSKIEEMNSNNDFNQSVVDEIFADIVENI